MSSRKVKGRGLGRGLDALFADQAPIVESEPESVTDAGSESAESEGGENRIVYLDINDIRPNKYQPRKNFDSGKITELANSILEHGIIQPLVVRQSSGIYEIVAGERRWRAAREAGLSSVPCIIREFTEEQNMLITIIENMQREDLNPIEEAEGLSQMIRTYGMTQEEVSKSVSKSRPYISNALRLLKLPPEIQKCLSEEQITAGHARALAGMNDEEKQMLICRRVIAEGLSVRETEKLANAESKPKKKPAKKKKSPDTLNVERELKDIYGTRVSINHKGKKGTIELEFYSMDELNRLIDLLRMTGSDSHGLME